MIDLERLITAQRNLQVKLGYHFEHMTPVEKIEYIKENVLAATDELHEALAETGWKSWATSQHINDDAYLGELRDAWQFLTNLMLVVEPDPVKLAERFSDSLAEKHGVNYRRVDNYDGVSTKCPSCKRALDEVTITELPGFSDALRWRCSCGTVLSPDVVRKLSND